MYVYIHIYICTYIYQASAGAKVVKDIFIFSLFFTLYNIPSHFDGFSQPLWQLLLFIILTDFLKVWYVVKLHTSFIYVIAMSIILYSPLVIFPWIER